MADIKDIIKDLPPAKLKELKNAIKKTEKEKKKPEKQHVQLEPIPQPPPATETKKEQEMEPKSQKSKKERPTFKVPKIAWFTITWLFLAIISLWLKYNVTLDVNNQISIATASISIMVNIIVLGAVFATGIGQKILKRFKNRLMFHTGKYVNTIYLTKNGTAKEIFKKVDMDTKTFNVLGQKFVRNPKLLFNFEKIPTYLHREGNPDPLNVWEDKIAAELSNAELDLAMTSSHNFDIKQWINNHKMIIAIALLIVIAVGIAAAISGFMNYQMLRDGTYKAVACVAQAANVQGGV